MTMSTAPKVALITGVTGQDGSYLAEFLLEKGYVVHGIKRSASLLNTQRVEHIYQDPHIANVRFKLHHGDLRDTSNLIRIIQETQPDEIYSLGAQSHVGVSSNHPNTRPTSNRLAASPRKLLAEFAESSTWISRFDSYIGRARNA